MKPMSLRACIQIALVFVGLQLCAALLLGQSSDDPRATYAKVIFPYWWEGAAPDYSGWLGRYRRLNEYDSLHYLSIAEFGYQQSGPVPSMHSIYSYRDNQAFFPAYPLAGRWVSKLAGAPVDIGLLLASQLMAFLAWLYFLLLLREWGFSTREGLRWAILALSFPTAFYFIAGYSESTFVAALLGYIYWYTRARKCERGRVRWLFWGLAAVHGVGLSSIRIVGAPLCGFPVLYELTESRLGRRPRWESAAALSGVALLGLTGFFAYLRWRFGRWDIHFMVQKIGWNNQADLLAFFKPGTYLPNFMEPRPVDLLSQACVPVFSAWVAFGAYKLWRHWAQGAKQAACLAFPYLALAGALLFVSVTGKSQHFMEGMIRYMLPVFLLLLLCAARLRSSRAEPAPRLGRGMVAGLTLLFALQLHLLWNYVHGKWVS